jgi:hypothetical protein
MFFNTIFTYFCLYFIFVTVTSKNFVFLLINQYFCEISKRLFVRKLKI